ncbi:MAG: sugar phosphate isomerase/epimerase family protein [Rhodothermales bacterium]
MMDRRTFLTASAAAAGGAMLGPMAASSTTAYSADGRPPDLMKAVKFNMIDVDATVREKFALLKELGFDGVEMHSPTDLSRQEVLDASRDVGLPIHGVVDMVHWNQPLSDPDPRVREAGREGLRTALNDAAAWRASTVLLVPAVVTAEVPYDVAYERSQEEIRTMLPEAESLGVRIAIENVWNEFLLSPLEFARYIDEFESEWIGAYFDIGNVVAFGWPEHWIRILGARTLKLDVKEFSNELRDEEGMGAGFRAPLGEGDVNWPGVLDALDDVGYSGWATAEIRGGGRERLAEIAVRMNRVLAL